MTYTPTEQANIDAMYRFMEAEAVRDFETMYRFIAPDCVSYGPGGMVTRGHEEMHAYDDVFFASLESLRRSIIDVAADGDTAVFRYRAEMVRPPERRGGGGGGGALRPSEEARRPGGGGRGGAGRGGGAAGGGGRGRGEAPLRSDVRRAAVPAADQPRQRGRGGRRRGSPGGPGGGGAPGGRRGGGGPAGGADEGRPDRRGLAVLR
ncbi:MAG: nuclear transport factor 2 family protein [Dehalococcoidia bacterium]|nr:nuclear transport factor 2 family protein [Dehalococcoidia bacterium]